MSKKFGLGYVKDAPHKRTQKSSRLLLGVSPTSPAAASLQQFEGAILDQGRSGSCTFHGTPQALWVTFKAAGTPLPFMPSPHIGYGIIRVLERASASVALTDSGAMPADIKTVIDTYGISPIQAPTPDGRYSDIWTADDVAGIANAPPPNINVEPVLADLEQAGTEIVADAYRIDETEADFTTQIMAAISGVTNNGVGRACGIGVFVDSAFMNYDGSTPMNTVNLTDPNGGGHWLALTYYYTMADGTLVFGGPNSWGSSWGKAGHYEVTAAWLKASVSDIYVFTIGAAQ